MASPDTTALCTAMVAELRELGAIRSDRIADAVRTVPPHLFAPGEPLVRIYAATTAMVTKRDERGAAISSVYESHIQATMLEQAQLEPGMRALEIGRWARRGTDRLGDPSGRQHWYVWKAPRPISPTKPETGVIR